MSHIVSMGTGANQVREHHIIEINAIYNSCDPQDDKTSLPRFSARKSPAQVRRSRCSPFPRMVSPGGQGMRNFTRQELESTLGVLFVGFVAAMVLYGFTFFRTSALLHACLVLTRLQKPMYTFPDTQKTVGTSS
jgi:hypothetical protein